MNIVSLQSKNNENNNNNNFILNKMYSTQIDKKDNYKTSTTERKTISVLSVNVRDREQ